MNWTNVKLILAREVRDQLRDRRMLFMIAVLPLLLYPLLGMTFFQVAQFVQEHATKVLVIGADELPDSPPLIEEVDGRRRFAANLFDNPHEARLIELHVLDQEQMEAMNGEDPAAWARRAVEAGEYSAVVHFPHDFADRLESVRERLAERAQEPRSPAIPAEQEAKEREAGSFSALLNDVPSPTIHYNTAREASALAFIRVSGVLSQWTTQIGHANLAAGGVPELAARPFHLATQDVAAEQGHRGSAIWAKVLPFVLLIWALTGAFYPAVDLCAGEKERGTLETLLSSPAERDEIVLGKLLTIMAFSMATAILNLLSMGITGQLILSQLPEFGSPPAMAPLWLLLALLPMSALFSALCLALAAFARSSKEGQYYLMPLLLVTMPLVILPMSPAFELTLGTCLIPVTGVVLLLRTVLEGNSPQQILPFVTPVVAVTLACCLLAIRWAVDQFNSESVLFRESERFDVALWLKHLMRDRLDTPNVAAAVFCAVLILMIRFFMGFALPQPTSFRGFAVLAVVTQLIVIASPALFMTIMLTRSPRKTLLLKAPTLAAAAAALLLALFLHPLTNLLRVGVTRLYPFSDELTRTLEALLGQPHAVWQMLIVMAVIPAICEELAFRGFMLSGFRHVGSKWRAIALSSLCFALAHAIFQQSILAFLVGLVIGYLAVQTGSLLPCILFHMTHNTLAILTSELTPQWLDRFRILRAIVYDAGEQGYLYQPGAIVAGSLAAAGLLYFFHRLEYSKTAEESLQEALDQCAAGSAGS